MLRSEDIYEAALAADALERLPAMIAAEAGGRSAVLCWFHPDGTPEMLGYSYFTAEQMDDYVSTFTPYDLWAVGALTSPRLNSVDVGERFMTPAAFERSVLHNEFFRKHHDDTWSCAGGAYQTPWGSFLIGVHREKAAGGFDEEEVRRLGRVAEHVRGSLSLRGQLASERRTAMLGRAALDAISTAVITLDARGFVTTMNAEAERLIASDFPVTRLVGRTLRTEDKRLLDAIALATLRSELTASCIQHDTAAGARWLITVTPAGPGSAMLAFRDHSSGAGATKRSLRGLFALTEAEAEVALLLGQGLGPEEVAARRGVSHLTVKAQVKSLRTKMSAARQSEIVAIVARVSLIRGPG